MNNLIPYNYKIIRSKRKTISLEISLGLEVIVRAPLSIPQKDIEALILKHRNWIDKHMEICRKRKEQQEKYALTETQIRMLKEKAKAIIPKKVEYYSKIMNLTPSSVKITSAKKRFGSCSSKKGLCFSYLLMLYPEEAIDYVVVHELAHIKHHNHSKDFYALVEKYMPDYKAREALLKNI